MKVEHYTCMYDIAMLITLFISGESRFLSLPSSAITGCQKMCATRPVTITCSPEKLMMNISLIPLSWLNYFQLTCIRSINYLQYRHLIPAPVDRTSAYAWLYKHPWITFQNIFAKHINDPRILWIKTTFSWEIIYATMPRKIGGNRACGRVFCPGRPRI